MPTLPYRPYPEVAASESAGTPFQTGRGGTPEAFGALQGRALEGLAQQIERTGDVFAKAALERQQLLNQVAADEASNNLEDTWNKKLYGDPNVPGDVGFFGQRGKAALENYPIVRKEIDELLRQQRGVLQNPIQQHLFDSRVRRTHNIIMSQTGRHYDSQFNKYQESVAEGQLKLSQQRMSSAAANNDDPEFKMAVGESMLAAEKLERAKGSSPEEIQAARNSAAAAAVKVKVQTMAANGDAAGALAFLDNNREYLVPGEYPQLVNGLKAEAKKQEVDMLLQGKALPKRAGTSLVRGGAVEQRISAEAAKLGLPAELALTIASIESNFGQTPDRPGSQHQGVFQLGDAAASSVGGRDVEHGVRFVAKVRDELAGKLGREPEGWEVYLGHQQGGNGAAALLNNPNTPAGQLVPARHISANGGDPNAPASAFVKLWRDKYVNRAQRIGTPPADNGATITISSAGPDSKNYRLTKAQADEYYAISNFAKQQEFLKNLPKEPDKVVGLPPADDPAYLPDDQVPGLLGELEKVAKRAVDQGRPDLVEPAVNALRRRANLAYSIQQQQRRVEQQIKKEEDEKLMDAFTRRMAPSSTNPPTVDEILLSNLSPEGKRVATNFLIAQAKGEAPAQVSAENQADLFRRMTLPDGSEEKIYGEGPINEAYINRQITWSAKEQLIKKFRDNQDPVQKDIFKRQDNLLRVIEPKLWPALVIGNKDRAKLVDPEGPQRVLDWSNAVELKIKEYRDANKNPVELFVKTNKDYVGSDEFIAQFNPPKFSDPKPNAVQVKPIEQMTTRKELEDAYKAAPHLKEQLAKRAIELGLAKPPTPVDTRTVPMAR